jgi:Fis family transcriptional regulator, factor for inversion stimulation protein
MFTNSALRDWAQNRHYLPATPRTVPTPAIRSLPELIRDIQSAGISYEDATRQFQERYILHTLAKHRGHIGKAAEELKMHRNTLSRMLSVLKVDVAKIRSDLRRPVVAARFNLLQSKQQIEGELN